MDLKIINKNDKRLKEKCTEVTDFENKKDYKELIKQMTKIVIDDYAFAAAAPQFGINKRFILMVTTTEKNVKNIKELEDLEVEYIPEPYFNPVITEMRGLQYFYEACMSVDDAIGKVARPYYIEFDYQDIDGNIHHRSAEDFEAIVFCHEIDHLDGIEFTDKAIDIIYNANLEKRIEVRNKNPREIVSKNIEFPQNNLEDKYKTKVYKK